MLSERAWRRERARLDRKWRRDSSRWRRVAHSIAWFVGTYLAVHVTVVALDAAGWGIAWIVLGGWAR